MFIGNIPEKVIADKSGHKSIKGLRFYEKTSALQEQVAGEVVSGANTTVVKDEPDRVDEKCDHDKRPETVNPAHTFPGTLNNCTINFHYDTITF